MKNQVRAVLSSDSKYLNIISLMSCSDVLKINSYDAAYKR